MSQNNGTYIHTFVLVINSYGFELMSQLQKKTIPKVIAVWNVK